MEMGVSMPVRALWRWKFGVLKKRRDVVWKVVFSVPAGFPRLRECLATRFPVL